ncbi:hypothetical protein AVEN_42454-1 [Araneus ventricosus]|uniref:Uncharacterized protein n=1 Tax=Araneus ventricosus TaxID=182803 RepID=A0A4Y2M426_ARAVE|nr:hypothetical protein AVEN_42454-1 [Araneus ventricosus]
MPTTGSLDHPPYSPEHEPWDFTPPNHLRSAWKVGISEPMPMFNKLSQRSYYLDVDFFCTGFDAFVYRRNKYFDSNGDYSDE